MHLIIPAEHAGKRLDQSLAELLPDYSRNRIQQWIDAGSVRIDGAAATRKGKVWGGEAVELHPAEHPSEQPYKAEAIDLDIVHEDDAVIVINKPPGLVVHPGAGNWEGTLLNALLHHCPALEQIPRAGIVHRLDKDTSGLLVVAKTLTAQTALVRALQARDVKRVYWAVAMGVFEHAEGGVDAPIGRHPIHRTRMAVVDNGKPARTDYRVLKQYRQAAWVECRLHTGRTHQIRVHLTHIGHPLVGDSLYAGRRQVTVSFHRQALHAYRLGFSHPLTGADVEWEAAMPEDFRSLIEALEHEC
ncbi:MAG: 23S rRNA pseudouridine(1911/1915/1917) synthase RluD [Thiobacillus sp.]|nr:23S rRNA pseudouridine(1911/1915/1917) synthase RluD [Thiobacillus sp.]